MFELKILNDEKKPIDLDGIKKSAELLLGSAEEAAAASSDALPSAKDEQAQYRVDKIRPMQIGADGQLHRFVVEEEGDLLINFEEEKLSYVSSVMLQSDNPYWVTLEDLIELTTINHGLDPVLSRHDVARFGVINAGLITNYRALAAAGALPSSPDLSPDKESQSWYLDNILQQDVFRCMNISIEEYGSCCVPCANVADLANDASARSTIYMPPMCLFYSLEGYCHTLFHEIIHCQLVKDRSLQSYAMSSQELQNDPEEAAWVRHKNEIAAELGSSLLSHLFTRYELPQKLDDYSAAYIRYHGVAYLSPSEHSDIVVATTKAVYHVLKAVPLISRYHYKPSIQEEKALEALEESRLGEDAETRRIGDHHKVVDVDYEVLNRLLMRNLAVQQRSHLERLLPQVKNQLKQQLIKVQAKQSQSHATASPVAVAKTELCSATTRMVQSNESNRQSKAKAQPSVSKGRDLER